MRWPDPIKGCPPPPRDGTERIREGFLWLPKEANGEWRWLERAEWVEVYRSYMSNWHCLTWIDN